MNIVTIKWYNACKVIRNVVSVQWISGQLVAVAVVETVAVVNFYWTKILFSSF